MFLSLPSRALPPAKLQVRAYGAEQGLLNQSVRVLAQDQVGFVWAGTDDGPFRFDGQAFRRIVFESGDAPAPVTALLADGGPRVWIASFRGLALWDGRRLRAFGPAEGLPRATPYALMRSGRRLWVGTRAGLWRSDDGEHFVPEPGWPGGACIELTGAGERVLALADGALVQRATTAGDAPWSPVATFPEALKRLRADARGRIWTASRTQLWMRERPDLPFRRMEGTLPAPMDGDAINLGEDRRGRLLIGTGGGMARYEGNDRWSRFGRAEGVPTAVFHSAIEDTEGSLWIGGSGAQWVALESPLQAYGPEQGVSAGYVSAILQVEPDLVWVATSSGLSVSDGDRWTTLAETRGREFRTLVRDVDGTVWAGDARGQLYELRGRSLVGVHGPESGLPATTLHVSRLDGSGTLWVGTADAGLWRRRTRPGRAPRFVREVVRDMPADEGILDLAEDREGRLWGAGNTGLYVRDRGTWRRLTMADGLRDPSLRSLQASADGRIRIGYQTSQPIDAVSATTTGWSIARDPSVPSDRTPSSVYFLGEDARRRVWIGTGHGVDVVDSGALQRLTRADGLPDDDSAQQAFHLWKDGGVWLGFASGLAHVTPRAGEPTPPTPVLGTLSTDQETRSLVESGAGQRPEVLPSGTRSVRIAFSALSFLHAARVRFEVRLDPVDSTWRETSAREIQYANLTPGSYTFKVRARLPGGGWSPSIATTWEVRPEWWQTGPFRAAIAAIVGSVIGWLAWVRLAQLRARAAVSEERNRLARALHDSLAQNFTGVLLQLENVKRMLQHRAAPELAAVLDETRYLALRGLEDARQSVWAIHGEDGSRTFVEGVEAIARRLLAGGAKGDVVVATTGRRWWPSRARERALVRIAGECMTNAFRHGGARHVSVLLRRRPLWSTLSVQDDGRGFDERASPRPDGFGLSSIAADAASLGGSLRIETAPGQGTLVEVDLPSWQLPGTRGDRPLFRTGRASSETPGPPV